MSIQPSQNGTAGGGSHGGNGGVGCAPVFRVSRSATEEEREAAGRVLRGEIGVDGRAGHPRGGDGGEGRGPVITMDQVGRYTDIRGGTGGNGGAGVRAEGGSVVGPRGGDGAVGRAPVITMEELGRYTVISGGTGGSGGAGVGAEGSSEELSVAEFCRKFGVSEDILKELDERGITTVGELRKLSSADLEKYGIADFL